MNFILRNFARSFVLIFALSLGVLAQTDVPRKTVAITYPLGETVNVQFRGTTRFPRLHGSATVKRMNKSGTRVELTLDNMPRPYELGAAYTTFILWAVTPEGRVDNLAEIKRRTGTVFDTRIVATTPLQTFALIVTAEPHFLAKEPSRAVILENIAPGGGTASFVNVQYFGNSSDYYRDPRVPEIAETDYVRTPVSLLGARQAINMAKFAGADRDAATEFEYAQKSLEQAEAAWRNGSNEDDVDILARQAISAGVKAEEVAGVKKEAREKRNEAARRDAEIRKAEDRVAQIQQELDETKAELERERRARELAERDANNSSGVLKDLRAEIASLRQELSRARSESEDAKVKLARAEGEKQAIDAQRQAQERIDRIRTNAPLLIQALKQFGTVKESARGITLVLPENIWSAPREMVFAATAGDKLERLAQILAGNPDYKVIVESHTDDRGNPDELLGLTEERARMLGDKLISSGVQQNRIETKGFGATIPLVSNSTAVNRAKNRRTEITLTIIGSDNQTTGQASQ